MRDFSRPPCALARDSRGFRVLAEEKRACNEPPHPAVSRASRVGGGTGGAAKAWLPSGGRGACRERCTGPRVGRRPRLPRPARVRRPAGVHRPRPVLVRVSVSDLPAGGRPAVAAGPGLRAATTGPPGRVVLYYCENPKGY